MRDNNKRDSHVGEDDSRVKRETILKLITLITIVGGVFGIYRIAIYFEIELALWLYLIAFTSFIVAYIIYNRAMTRRGVTVDMLPDEWSYEEKVEFIEDGKQRLKKSSWMLMFIIAFIFTFAFDLLELYALPFLEELL